VLSHYSDQFLICTVTSLIDGQGLGHSLIYPVDGHGTRALGNLLSSIESPTTLCTTPFIGILDAYMVNHLHDVYSKAKYKLSISKENYSAADGEQTSVCTISRYCDTQFYYFELLGHSAVLSQVA
jgi:hypothetical protein